MSEGIKVLRLFNLNVRKVNIDLFGQTFLLNIDRVGVTKSRQSSLQFRVQHSMFLKLP